MKRLLPLLALALCGLTQAQTSYNRFAPANGVLVGDETTYVTTPAESGDIRVLWTGTCDATTYLRGDGSCQAPPGGGGGTVDSVGLTAPSVFSVTNSPITTTGDLVLDWATGQTANSFLASPDGSTGAISLRAIVADDLPAIDLTSGVTGILPVPNGGSGAATLTGPLKGNGTSAFSAAAAADIYGLWSGTCSSSTFLRGDGSCETPAPSAAALTRVDDTNVTLTLGGTPSTALLQATSITAGWTGQLAVARGGTGAATLTGPIKGNGTSAFSAAASSDIYGLWSGTCNSDTYLRGDGSCQTPSGGAGGANPTASVGLTAVNGVSTSFLRADGAPALSQSIIPTWTGKHTFTAVGSSSADTVQLSNTLPMLRFTETDASANEGNWQNFVSGGIYVLRTANDANSATSNVLLFDRTGSALTSLEFGNSTDNNTVTFAGTGSVTSGGPLRVGDGAVSIPSLSFASDTDSGLYLESGTGIAVAFAGARVATFRPGLTQIDTGVLRVPGGTAAAPGYTISTDPNTGLYSTGADSLGLTTGGTNRVTVGPGVQVGAPTGGDQGAGTINATGLYVNGAPVGYEQSSGNAGVSCTGFSSVSTCAGTYSKTGNIVCLRISANGTSNASTFGISTLPAAARPNPAVNLVLARITDNGTATVGGVVIGTNGVMEVWNGLDGSGTFTTSGTKGVILNTCYSTT